MVGNIKLPTNNYQLAGWLAARKDQAEVRINLIYMLNNNLTRNKKQRTTKLKPFNAFIKLTSQTNMEMHTFCAIKRESSLHTFFKIHEPFLKNVVFPLLVGTCTGLDRISFSLKSLFRKVSL